MSSENIELAKSAIEYIDHAKALNKLAHQAAKTAIEEDKATLELKISFGLSLQAAELAGKSMLRSLGMPIDEIRKKYRNHDVSKLLGDVAIFFEQDPTGIFNDLDDFLCWQPTIEGQVSTTSLGWYLSNHFQAGPSAMPRSYFYPDEVEFSGPQPPDALLMMVDELIRVATEAANRRATA